MPNTKYEVLLEHFIKKLPPLDPQPPSILLGLSGGPDSVFLFHQLIPLHKKGLMRLSAAHLDHGWRPSSGQDALFCKELCEKHGIPLYTSHAQQLETQVIYNGSQEEYGRNLRRYFFEQTRLKYSIDYYALAHHKQDQEETFFIRLIRGASLQGLVGIKSIEGRYIRPLLSIDKAEIIAYLHDNNIAYCVDTSNESKEYLRNRIRLDVIPALEKCDPRFHTKFHDTLHNLATIDTYLEKITLEVFRGIFNTSPETLNNQQKVIGDLRLFLESDPVIQNRLIILWLSSFGLTFTPHKGYLDEVMRFLHSPRGGSHTIGPSLTIYKKSNTFWLEKTG